jgi:two-component sensor histidine kinase
VIDDGVGLPPGFDPARSDRLGLQIVRTLADADLHSAVEWKSRAGSSAGTMVSLRVKVT